MGRVRPSTRSLRERAQEEEILADGIKKFASL
jgi:hypothetical protein